jgi:hypothetical protein
VAQVLHFIVLQTALTPVPIVDKNSMAKRRISASLMVGTALLLQFVVVIQLVLLAPVW